MKRKTKIEGVEISTDDGDFATSDITELGGELAEEADKKRLEFLRRQLHD